MVAAALTLWSKSVLQGIKQQPIRTTATVIVIWVVGEEITVPFHFPNHCSIKFAKGLSVRNIF